MAKRGRLAGFRMSEEHRSKIALGKILNHLNKVATGELEGSQVSVNAGLGLLRKVLPDLSANQISGGDEPVKVETIITGVRRAGE